MIAGPRPLGRPRDPAIDAAVLAATRELLVEAGFAGTTVHEIARRSGVHPPAIYRRWPSRISLIEDAAFSEMVEVPVEPTGDLRADLLRFLEAYGAMLDRAPARAAIPGLLASYQGGAEPPADMWAHLSLRPRLQAILAASSEPVDPAVDPDEVFDLLLVTMLSRILVPPLAARLRPLDRAVDLVVRVLRPDLAPAGPPRPGAIQPRPDDIRQVPGREGMEHDHER